jgi:hypothetical protein
MYHGDDYMNGSYLRSEGGRWVYKRKIKEPPGYIVL